LNRGKIAQTEAEEQDFLHANADFGPQILATSFQYQRKSSDLELL
jgi:hypothetical protein